MMKSRKIKTRPKTTVKHETITFKTSNEQTITVLPDYMDFRFINRFCAVAPEFPFVYYLYIDIDEKIAKRIEEEDCTKHLLNIMEETLHILWHETVGEESVPNYVIEYKVFYNDDKSKMQLCISINYEDMPSSEYNELTKQKDVHEVLAFAVKEAIIYIQDK